MSLTQAVTESIEEIRKNPSPELRDNPVYDRILMALDYVEEDKAGWPMAGKCGTASGMLWDHLPAVMAQKGWDIKINTALAEHKHTFAHVYNPIWDMRSPDEEIICDLSISQFVSNATLLFGGKPYFVGTRNELKEIVLGLRDKTLAHMQSNFPDRAIKTYADVDDRMENDQTVFGFYMKAKNRFSESLLLTEKQEGAWEQTWGDYSRYRPIFNYSMPYLHLGK